MLTSGEELEQIIGQPSFEDKNLYIYYLLIFYNNINITIFV